MVCLQTQEDDFAVHTWLEDYPCNPQTYSFNVVLLLDTPTRKFPHTLPVKGIFLTLEIFFHFKYLPKISHYLFFNSVFWGVLAL